MKEKLLNFLSRINNFLDAYLPTSVVVVVVVVFVVVVVVVVGGGGGGVCVRVCV